MEKTYLILGAVAIALYFIFSRPATPGVISTAVQPAQNPLALGAGILEGILGGKAASSLSPAGAGGSAGNLGTGSGSTSLENEGILGTANPNTLVSTAGLTPAQVAEFNSTGSTTTNSGILVEQAAPGQTAAQALAEANSNQTLNNLDTSSADYTSSLDTSSSIGSSLSTPDFSLD